MRKYKRVREFKAMKNIGKARKDSMKEDEIAFLKKLKEKYPDIRLYSSMEEQSVDNR